MKRYRESKAAGFTLVELLVVIAIIGVLVALLLPAVQAAREAARRLTCQAHLHNIGLAALNLETAHRYLPSGGWGWDWSGDADRGFGEDQPGGWIYNVMPFLEEDTLHAIASDGNKELITDKQKLGARKMLITSMEIFYCPSRREATPYPTNRDFLAHNSAPADKEVDGVGRTDYAANCGSLKYNEFYVGPSPKATMSETASSFSWATTDTAGTMTTTYAYPDQDQDGKTVDRDQLDGVTFERSEIALRQITDGTSKTYFAAEKFMPPAVYETGSWEADNETWCTGFNNDNFRTAYLPSAQDTDDPLPDGESDLRFGSAHVAGFYAVYCDGSVRLVNYNVDDWTHRYAASRDDGKVIEE